MQNNRKRNVIKERIRQEKERRERLLAEEEEQYEDIHENQVSEKFQQDHSEQPLKQSENREKSEESVVFNTPKNEASNSNPALDWITTIQKQSSTSESDFNIEQPEAEARRKAEEETREREKAEARRKAEEEAREREEAEVRRKAEEETRKREEAEARKKAEEETRKREEAEARKKA
ncbi:hypothetical protein ICY_04832, partial [Bacillus cereus BAG2X1-3]